MGHKHSTAIKLGRGKADRTTMTETHRGELGLPDWPQDRIYGFTTSGLSSKEKKEKNGNKRALCLLQPAQIN